MAFQKQFKTSYLSYNGWDYYLEIWVNATAGTITTSEIKLGTGGPIISYDTDNEDRFSPIISSNCVIPLVIESSIQENFVKQLREVYNERDVYVHLYKSTEAQSSAVKPLWSGFVLMDLSSTPDEFYPYDFKITAIDGLGLLKDIDFVKPTTRRANEYIEADMYYGPGRYTFWLKEILLKTGASTTTEGSSEDYVFTTAINWYESKMPTITQSLDPFFITKCSVGMFHTKTDNGVFEVTNCYEVLKELLRHWGARMTYWKGQFWIVQIPQYITPDSGTYINPDNINTRTYDKTGTFISSSDNLGDSYYTRYQLNIGDLTGGIQKLTGTEVNYLPQIREARANNVSFGNGNRYGGFPREFTGNSAPGEIIFQDQINDASDSNSFQLVIPLNINIENGNPFNMRILFNFYCTDLTNTYYLQYDATLTHKYYWVSLSQWTTLVNAPTWDSGFISPATGNINQSQSHSNVIGFDQQILFKLYNTSTQAFSDLDLSGNFKFYLDIDSYGTNSGGSFRFKFSNASLSTSQFFYPTHPSINVSWTNTLQSNYALQTPNIITNNAPNGNSIIQLTAPEIDPFEGMFVVITNTTGSIYGNSYVASVNTTDVAIVDFGTLIWGDTLQISDLGCLQVFNGSSFEKSSSSGNWGNGILTGSLSFTQILLDEYLYGQTQVIESPSMRLVTSVLNRDSSDGSGLRPNFINPIGRLKESRTNLSDVQYVFKRGAFYTLTDEWDYEGFEIRRDVSSVITTVKEITGPNNPVTGVGSFPKSITVPNSFGQIISKQIITSTSNAVAAGAITSLPIALINDVVFKVGDFFNVLNSDTNEFIKFELNGQQFSDSSSLTVVSQTITDNIPANSIITFNALDLTSQYQNKTRGTVAGFDITATGIEKSSINITEWLNSDTMTGAAVTNVPTALSVKNYVDGQVGASDTLQEVTDNGNTTTNSIMIGSSSSPTKLLTLKSNTLSGGGGNLLLERGSDRSTHQNYIIFESDSYGDEMYIGTPVNSSEAQIGFNQANLVFKGAGYSEKIRLTSGGNLLIGTTADNGNKLQVTGNSFFTGSVYPVGGLLLPDSVGVKPALSFNNDNTIGISRYSSNTILISGDLRAGNVLLTGSLTGTTATFSGQVTIPATPVANTDSASKSYVDAHGGGLGPFLPLAGGTLTGDLIGENITLGNGSTDRQLKVYYSNINDFVNVKGYGIEFNRTDSYLRPTSGNSKNMFFGNPSLYWIQIESNAVTHKWTNASAEKMRLTSGGNLGIGTSNPSDIFEVKGSAATPPSVAISLTGNDARIKFTETFSTGTSWLMGIQASSDKFVIANSGSSLGTNQRLTIDSVGAVTFTGALTGTSATFSGNSTFNSNFTVGGVLYIDNIQTRSGVNIDFRHQDGTVKMQLKTGTGNLLIGTTVDSGIKLVVNSSTNNVTALFESTDAISEIRIKDDSAYTRLLNSAFTFKIMPYNGVEMMALDGNNEHITIPTYAGTNQTGTATYLLGTDATGKILKTTTIPSGSGGPFLPLAGGTLTGGLTGTTAIFSGNVGTGTLTTSTGNIKGSSHLFINAPSSYLNLRSTTSDIYYDGVNHYFRDNSGSEKMRLTSAGRLGVGLTNPSGLIHAKQTANDARIIVETDSNGSNSAGAYFEAKSEYQDYHGLGLFSGTSPIEKWFIGSFGSSYFSIINGKRNDGTKVLNVTTDNRVGIGTTSPTRLLEVESAADAYIRLQSTASLSGSAIFEMVSGGTGNSFIKSTNNALYLCAEESGVGVIIFRTGGTNERARITSGGNLLIGTTSDSGYKLDINGTTRITGELRLASNINQYTGDFSVWVANVGQAFTIKPNSGNVLIGSTSDNGAKLQVTGIIRTTGGSFQAGQDYGYTLQDESNNNRYGLKFGVAGSVGGSNLLMLTNRSLSSATGGGEVAIAANASTSGVTETEVVRVKANTQSEVSIDGVLSLTKQDTPANPPNNSSTIWLDSNFDLKIKITNNSGDTVTKTIVEYA